MAAYATRIVALCLVALPGAQEPQPKKIASTDNASSPSKTVAEGVLFRGLPTKHWRARIKNGEVSCGGWTGFLWIPDGKGELVYPDTKAAEGLAPLFIELLKDSETWMRELAALELGNYGGGRWQMASSTALAEALGDKDRFVRWMAALSLQRINPRLEGQVAKNVAAVLEQGKGMEHISYRASSMTDADMTDMRRWANLRGLNASGTQITDAGLANLSGLPRLIDLDISSTTVTDAGIAYLKTVSSLCSLDLSHTRVTDAGLVHLRALPRLTSLKITGTSVTDMGIQELRRSLPKLKVVR